MLKLVRNAALFQFFVLVYLVPTLGFAESHTGRNIGRLAKERREAQQDLIKTEFPIHVKDGCVDESQPRHGLLQKLNAGQQVPFNEITDELVHIHLADSKKKLGEKALTADQLELILGKIRTGVDREDLHKMKIDYEALLEGHFDKSPTVYNAAATSIADICDSNKMQCYSGTVLNQVIARKVLSKEKFLAKNPVIIFEEGHVLPGYMIQNANGDWELVGIETTSKGRAQVNYGRAKDLRSSVRVVDANQWMLSELYKDCLAYPNVDTLLSLIETAKKYQIPVDAMAAQITGLDAKQAEALNIASQLLPKEWKEKAGSSVDEAIHKVRTSPKTVLAALESDIAKALPSAVKSSNAALNSSPFAFGEAKTPAGDIERSSFDGRTRVSFGTNTNDSLVTPKFVGKGTGDTIEVNGEYKYLLTRYLEFGPESEQAAFYAVSSYGSMKLVKQLAEVDALFPADIPREQRWAYLLVFPHVIQPRALILSKQGKIKLPEHAEEIWAHRRGYGAPQIMIEGR